MGVGVNCLNQDFQDARIFRIEVTRLNVYPSIPETVVPYSWFIVGWFIEYLLRRAVVCGELSVLL